VQPTTAIILGAGKGTRLGKLSIDRPKILQPIDGRPLLDYQLAYLADQGIERVLLNTHYLAEQVADHLRHSPPIVPVITSYEPMLLGTAGAVLAMDHWLSDTPVFILYGDVMVRAELATLWERHQQLSAEATLAIAPIADATDKGIIICDEQGWVQAFREKDPIDAGRPALINSGLMIIDPGWIRRYGQPNDVLDFGHDVLPQALANGDRIAALKLTVPALDIGTPEMLSQAQSGR
jgi:mannose-1-phosphate guanylyltransferase